MRLDEAKKLITRLSRSHEDPFIMDSMGWVLSPGQADRKPKTLETAYGIKADPEIAASRRGAVDTGTQEEASRVVMEAVKKFPRQAKFLASALKNSSLDAAHRRSARLQPAGCLPAPPPLAAGAARPDR